MEAKLLKRPTFGAAVAACRQSEAAAGDLEIPIVVVKKSGSRDIDALVCFRLEVFAEWFLYGGPTTPGPNHPSMEDEA